MSKRIFISYSHKDAAAVNGIVEVIRQTTGEDVWYDPELRGGENYWEVIAQQLDGCTHLVFVMSKNSVGSQWCMRELQYAADENKTIVPICLDNATTPQVKLAIMGIHQIEYYRRPDDLAMEIGKVFGRRAAPVYERQDTAAPEAREYSEQRTVASAPQAHVTYRTAEPAPRARTARNEAAPEPSEQVARNAGKSATYEQDTPGKRPGTGWQIKVVGAIVVAALLVGGIVVYRQQAGNKQTVDMAQENAIIANAIAAADATWDNPAQVGEWIHITNEDNPKQEVYCRVSKIVYGDEAQAIIDEYDSDHMMPSLVLERPADDTEEYCLFDYEIYFPADYPESFSGIDWENEGWIHPYLFRADEKDSFANISTADLTDDSAYSDLHAGDTLLCTRGRVKDIADTDYRIRLAGLDEGYVQGE